MSSEAKYKKKIASFLSVDTSSIFFYWKGRVALFAVLKAMGIGPGDEIILPAFTCVVVPNSILYLGAKPVYVDINSTTLCCRLDEIKKAVTSSTRAILIQNMLGLSDQVKEISSFAKERGIYTIEDCTHGFGGVNDGILNGLQSDASFFSTQWNKPFSTGIGGVLLVNNSSLVPQVNKINSSLIQPGLIEQYMLWLLLFVRKYFVKGRTYWTLLHIYRWLSKHGLVLGSSTAGEVQGISMPKGYFKNGSKIQFREGVRALSKFDRLIILRKKNAYQVHSWLLKEGKITVPMESLGNHAFLRYPLLVQNREVFLAKAEKARLSIGDWFSSPLHPVKGDLSLWGLNSAHFPNARYISDHIVNLPLEVPINHVLGFLDAYKAEIK